jgi:RNA polymerase sigma factor (sigma-70 family)
MLKKQQLIEDNMGLVYHLVSKEYPTYLQDEDIIQCGMLGLCKAAEKWDESKSKFSTFALICIRSEIQMEFRKRAKHQGILSLDYELEDGEGGTFTFGDTIAGDEDVSYIDIGIDLNRLNEKERKIAELLLTGTSQLDIATQLGVSTATVCRTVRKIRIMRGYANEC